MLRQLLPALVLLLLIWSLFGTRNTLELRAEEPRRAIVSLEMVLQNNWTMPTIHGEPYYNKPPLFNWVLGGFYKLTGSTNEWVTRLPGLLSLMLLAGALYLFNRKYLNETMARWSALFLLTTGDLLLYGAVNSGEIDLFYTLICFLQIAAIFHFFQQRNWWLLFLLSYLFTAAGCLTKGLPSLPLQAFSLLVIFGSRKEFKRLFSLAHFAGIALFLGLVSAYFVSYAEVNDPWPYLTNLIKEASHKTGAETPLSQTVGHFFIFPLQVVQILLPWSLLLVFWFRKGFKKAIQQNQWVWFSALFIVANIWIYWVSPGTKNRYLYVFFPFFITLLVWGWYRFRDEFPKITRWGNLGVSIALGIGVLALLALPWVGGDLLIRPKPMLLWLLPVMGIGALLLQLRKPAWRPLALVVMLLIVRVGYNEVYLPTVMAKEERLNYRSTINQVLLITKEDPVFFTGPTRIRKTEAAFGPVSFGEYELKLPPLLPYQVPYYLSRSNGHVMAFHPKARPGNWYISSLATANLYQSEIYFEFRDHWTQQDLALFRVKVEGGFAGR